MTIRSLWPLICLLVPCVATAAPPPGSLRFEEAVRMSDRVVIGTVQGTSGGSVRLPDGGEIVLGIKDAATGLVFTPYRVRVSLCLFDKDDSCRLEDMEVVIPGGTVYETVDGEQRLRTWEVAGAAGVPLPPPGDEVLLFMTKRNDRYLPLNDRGARVPVDRSSGSPSVVLRFESARFLSAEGLESARARAATGNPATTRPVFIEAVPLDRLKGMIALARQVPKPTSGTRHAIPDRADACASDTLRERGARARAGDDSQRRESPLGLGNHLDSIHRPDDGRWAFGP
jgi:hypothetical protein